MKWLIARNAVHRAVPQPAAFAAAVEKANELQRAGQFAESERLYNEVLQHYPSHPDALNFLGVLRIRQQRMDDAIVLIEAAAKEAPDYVDAHINLGNAYKLLGRLDDAQRSYERALELRPCQLDALHNLAVVLEADGRIAEARAMYRRLLAVSPPRRSTLFNYGRFLRRNPMSMTDIEEALNCFTAILRHEPGYGPARSELGLMLYLLERRDEAAAVYRDWLAHEPHHPVARHMLAAAGGAPAPGRADDAFIKSTFDSFAASFDEMLVDNLNYVAPQRLLERMAPFFGNPDGRLSMLDAGCGTGLCGPLFRPFAAELVGVDLSAGMLHRADGRGYDRLEVAELSDFLASAEARWEAVLSADTLIYFGDLRELFGRVASALVDGGLFGCTLEALPDEEDRFELSMSGRFRHSRRHVENALSLAGFVDACVDQASLRQEAGRPVPGWIVVARRRDRAVSVAPTRMTSQASVCVP